MNNLLSLSWLAEFVDRTVPNAELAKRLSLIGAGVEHVYPQGSELNKIVVGKIMALEPHPNADALTVCKVQVGNEIRTIVCGGSNLRRDQLVAVALPGSRVKWHGAGELVEIAETELRGVKSAGMIAAACEIGLGEALPAAGEREILDLEFLTRGAGHHVHGAGHSSVALRTGTPLAAALTFTDTIFDIEATTNRPDLMSVVGIAREAVAAGAAKIKSAKSGATKVGAQKSAPNKNTPKIFAERAALPKIKNKVPLTVAEKKLCPRYIAARVSGVQVRESPWWLRRRLIAAGVRPINNIVDITNYVRLEWGQPLHAFDAARVTGKLIVRRAHDGEHFIALDNSTHQLSRENLVIADDAAALCVAGVMGGRDSGVSAGGTDGRTDDRSDDRAATTEIIFEAATFDAVSVRRTSRALGLYSDSQLLFEKGLSTRAPEFAMARTLELTAQLAGGTVTALTDFSAAPYRVSAYTFDFSCVANFIGAKISPAAAKKILTSLGFQIKGAGARGRITVPWWRDGDIESPMDFMEEIARVYGYHNVPSALPVGAPPERAAARALTAEKNLRTFLVAQGFNEVYTNSLITPAMAKKSGIDTPMLALTNPLNADLTHLRRSLLPSFLKVVAENEAEFPSGKIFEVSNVYTPREGDTPLHELYVGAVVWLPPAAEKDRPAGAFAAAKGVAEELFRAWHIVDAFDYAHKTETHSWHPGRTITITNKIFPIGVVAEVHPRITAAWGIAGRVGIFLARAEPLWEMRHALPTYTPSPTFPVAKRDVAVVLAERVPFVQLADFFATFDHHLTAAELFDTYRGAQIGTAKKSLAFHLTYGASDRTLATSEIDALQQKLTAQLAEKFDAEIRV